MTQTIGSRLQLNATTIWPVWRDSVRQDVIFAPISRKESARTWHKARRWEQNTRQPGKHGGIIGKTALAVLQALLSDFLNYRTGRLDPSIAGIAQKAAVCARSAHTALQKLRALGLINWARRCREDRDEDGRFRLRQETNAYMINPTASWGPRDPPAAPIPSRAELGSPQPHLDTIETAIAAITAGEPATAYQILTSDTGDQLARALAQLGRAMGRF